MIRLVVRIAGRYGLNINKGKSYILLCNHRGIPPERVQRIAVAVTENSSFCNTSYAIGIGTIVVYKPSEVHTLCIVLV